MKHCVTKCKKHFKKPKLNRMKCDLLVVGGGPAGLSASVGASSEGLATIICDSAQRFGGQAGESSLIENFLGFPDGISGVELTSRAINQASKFDVEFKAPFNAVSLNMMPNKWWTVVSDDDEAITCKAICLAIGVTYKSLSAKNLSRYMGAGVSYGSPSLSTSYAGKTVCIIGGANSAGQAAVHLAQCSDCNVVLIVRGNAIEDRMSNYLVKKVSTIPNIRIMTHTEIIEAKGRIGLESIIVCNGNEQEEIQTERLFILIGAKPKTLWLKDSIALDPNGFILTGLQPDHPESLEKWGRYGLNRNPTSFECSAPGVFACGDVRSASTKRVANAIGEGSSVINEIHKYLSTLS
jgi:thioredoxin reductase (NADPH)